MSSATNASAWVRWAEEDVVLALLAARRPQPLAYGACFHVQQTAEKYLKAVLVTRGQPFPRTHDLLLLLSLCPQGSGPAVHLHDLNVLSVYAVQVRYPGPMPTPREARQALLSAGRVRRACRRFLGLA